MQKRTNPLALKREAQTESEVLREKEIELDSPAASGRVAPRAPKPEKVSSSAPRTDKTIASPRRPEDVRTAKSVTMDSGATITYAATPRGVVATRTEAPVVEPEPMERWVDDVKVTEPDLLDDEVIEDDGLVLDEQPETALDDTPAASEVIEDEEVFPTLQDFELAARFSLRGKNSRKLVIGKVSRDVLRLAQLLHPEEKMATIIENALMTRIFLENPEAFDAMASVIEENGGRIKC